MDNFLDTESPSIPSDENLFKSTALTEAALMGVYATMTDTYIYGQKLWVNWQGASDVEAVSYTHLDVYKRQLLWNVACG